MIPDANVIENPENFQIELAAPGLERKDFTVETRDGVLNISVEKEQEKNEEGKNFKRREFSSVLLPARLPCQTRYCQTRLALNMRMAYSG